MRCIMEIVEIASILVAVIIVGVVIGFLTRKLWPNVLTWKKIRLFIESINWKKLLAKDSLFALAGSGVAALAAYGFDWTWLYGVAGSIYVAYQVVQHVYESTNKYIAEVMADRCDATDIIDNQDDDDEED